jgi:hypothetical protein
MAFFRALALLAALGFVSPAVAQAPDIETGVRVTGQVSAGRDAAANAEGEPARTFVVENGDVMFGIRLNEATSATVRWDAALARARSVTVRMSAIKPEGRLKASDPRLASDVLCFADSVDRGASLSTFALTCVSLRERREALSGDGMFNREIGIAVVARRNSPTEMFLIASGTQPIFATLEP